jgi:hypothetical protein
MAVRLAPCVLEPGAAPWLEAYLVQRSQPCGLDRFEHVQVTVLIASPVGRERSPTVRIIVETGRG